MFYVPTLHAEVHVHYDYDICCSGVLVSLLMLKSKTFVRKTRSGAVQKITREHYLRDDLSCGVRQCSLCQQQGSEAVLDPQLDSPSSLCSSTHFLLPDTNILLHQTDFLEDRVITNVLIPQIALQVHNLSYLPSLSFLSSFFPISLPPVLPPSLPPSISPSPPPSLSFFLPSPSTYFFFQLILCLCVCTFISNNYLSSYIPLEAQLFQLSVTFIHI